MTISRSDKSGFAAWWWTTDRVAFSAVIVLIALGLMLACAASPAATGSAFTAGDFRYAAKQIAFAAVACVILVFVSSLSLKAVKLSAAIVYALALIGSTIVLFTGDEVLGAKRWIDFGWMTLQPSEFLKPGFAVLGASILADKAKMILPKEIITLFLIAPALVVLVLQPDVGQTGLLLALWGALLFFNGISLAWIGALASGTAGMGFAAYFLVDHVRHRVDQFFSHDKGGYQTGLALKAFAHGGLTGVGPGAGTVKYHIPDAHSDFIFAVAGEEFGLILCGTLAALFCLLSVRLLLRSARSKDAFSALCGASLATVIALQAFINMGVAVSLLPAKGMTLPFISYGGSSLFAVALTVGYALSVTRQRTKIGERDHAMFGFLKEARA
jgi:cell division protein FtsW